MIVVQRRLWGFSIFGDGGKGRLPRIVELLIDEAFGSDPVTKGPSDRWQWRWKIPTKLLFGSILSPIPGHNGSIHISWDRFQHHFSFLSFPPWKLELYRHGPLACLVHVCSSGWPCWRTGLGLTTQPRGVVYNLEEQFYNLTVFFA